MCIRDRAYTHRETSSPGPDKPSTRSERTPPVVEVESDDIAAFASSTPSGMARGRPRFRQTPVRRTGPRLTVRDWSYMPGRRNRRRRRNLQRKISYSNEGEISVPEEVNKKKTGLRWKAKKPRSLKYVDDSMTLAKNNMDSAREEDRLGKIHKFKHDIQSQNVFRRVVSRAEDRGMVVNWGKTKILCISDSQSYKAHAMIKDGESNELTSGEHLKVLGFHMDLSLIHI